MNTVITNTYNDKKYNDYMSQHNLKNMESNDKPLTHTRMPNVDMNIYPGSFVFSKDELKNFLSIYTQHVFVNRKKEYLTEKQIKNGPLLVDMDFRYNKDIVTRQHSKEDKKDIILLYLDEIKEVPDPYFGMENGFDIVYEMLDVTCEIIARKLKSLIPKNN
jgi:hypothetical protein